MTQYERVWAWFASRGRHFADRWAAGRALAAHLMAYIAQPDILVLALPLCGVSYRRAIYRAVSHYPAIIDDAIIGSPERLRPAELGGRAAAVLRPYAEERQHAAQERLVAPEASSTAHTGTAVRQPLPAAATGLVETAFVAIDQEQWGCYDHQTDHVLLHPERQPADEDLLNLIALEAIRYGGSAYAVPADAVPRYGPCVARLRHAAHTVDKARVEPWQ